MEFTHTEPPGFHKRKTGYASHFFKAGRRPPLHGSGQLTLDPGQAGCFPARDGTPVPLAVGRSFESSRNIMAGTVSHRCQSLRGMEAPLPRTADEEKFSILVRSQCREGGLKLACEVRIWLSAGKALPFDTQELLAQGRKIRNADKGPFCLRPDVYQDRSRIIFKPFPNLLYLDVIDAALRCVIGQNKVPFLHASQTVFM